MSTDMTKSMEALVGEMIFVEELTANDCEAKVLNGFSVSRTVRDIQKAIAVELGQPNSWEGLQAIYAGTILEDLDSTLASHNVVNGDTIYFVRSVTQPLPPPYPGTAERQRTTLANLFFRDLDGKTQNLHQVPVDSAVKEIVSRYGDEKAVDVDWLRFIYGGKQIWPSARPDDTRSLRDYGVDENSTIHVTARLRGGMGDAPQYQG